MAASERDPVFEEVVEGRHRLPGYPSCAPLVHWCLRRAGLRNDHILNRDHDLIPWRKEQGISCLVHNGRAFRWARRWWKPHGLQPGDMAFLGHGDKEHVCIVAEATDDTVVSYEYGRFFRGKHGGRRVTRRVRFDKYGRVHLSTTKGLGLLLRGRLDPFRLLKGRFARGELAPAEVPDDFEGGMAGTAIAAPGT